MSVKEQSNLQSKICTILKLKPIPTIQQQIPFAIDLLKVLKKHQVNNKHAKVLKQKSKINFQSKKVCQGDYCDQPNTSGNNIGIKEHSQKLNDRIRQYKQQLTKKVQPQQLESIKMMYENDKKEILDYQYKKPCFFKVFRLKIFQDRLKFRNFLSKKQQPEQKKGKMFLDRDFEMVNVCETCYSYYQTPKAKKKIRPTFQIFPSTEEAKF